MLAGTGTEAYTKIIYQSLGENAVFSRRVSVASKMPDASVTGRTPVWNSKSLLITVF